MKLKKIIKITFLLLAGLIAAGAVGISGTLFFQKIKLEKLDKKLLDKEISDLNPEIGKKKKFYADVFAVKNIDKAPYLLIDNVVEKNLIIDSDFLGDTNSFQGYSTPLTSGIKKITVELISSNEEFKLIAVRSSEVKNDASSLLSFLKYKPSSAQAIVEDSKGTRYAMRSTRWFLNTNSAFRAFEATKKNIREENNLFNERLKIYKNNPVAHMELKYCGSKTGQALFEQEVHHFDVEKRMNEILGKIFDPKVVTTEKMRETEVNGIVLDCYNFKFDNIGIFLKAYYILPKAIYGFWDK
ncbi:MAG: hypothetical protein H7336_09355 [Bacteriovorax sp.]|nr:hypothetical protein [Bacteriovorax sp.]